MEKRHIKSQDVPRLLIVINIALSLLYFSWWLNFNHSGQPILYSFLLFGEIYHIVLALTFWLTVWPSKISHNKSLFELSSTPGVDIFIPVAGEPIEIIRQTVVAAKNIDYPNFNVWILNDGFVAKKSNWKEIEYLARDIGVRCITRKIPGGAKAGNINNALRKTKGELVVIFDADMVASSQFLKRVVPFFKNKRVAFVQAPQYYKNFNENTVTKDAWQQQAFFFGPIMEGKGRQNSAILCGTNVILRRTALESVGGIAEDNIAEDFITSLFIYQKGWKSVYINEILAQGLAPQDLLAYCNQQYRWARGSLEVLFKHNPFFKRGLSLQQRIQYFSSALFYFNGAVVLIDLLIPLLYLFTGIAPVREATTLFASYFIPFVFVTFYTLFLSSAGELTFGALSFSHSIFITELMALISLIIGKKAPFVVTPKQASNKNFVSLVWPHIIIIFLSIIGITFAIIREGVNPSVATNISWALFNDVMFLPFIAAAADWSKIFNFQLRFKELAERT